MKKIILYIWQFPQHLLALCILFLFKNKISLHSIYLTKNVYKISTKVFSGVSLGNYIFLNELYFSNGIVLSQIIKHEYGHSIQSLLFGPFYLLIIGIPSLCNNILARFSKTIYNKYYTLYPEKWADILGNVVRKIN